MANLYEILDNANEGGAIATLGREFDLTPEQTRSAVAALLPAISSGLKQSTTTVDGLGNLFALMGQQQDLPRLYDDAQTALKPQGLAAGNDALSVIFGSPQVTQAVVDQAQKFSGVSSTILQKMLPVIAGMILSGLMRSGSSSAKPSAPAPSSPSTGDMGGLGDILGQIFGRGTPGSGPAPSSGDSGGMGDILGQIFGKGSAAPETHSGPLPTPTDTGGQARPGGDLLGTILRELTKGIQNGTIKPVIVGGGGPVQIPMPGGDGSGSGAPQVPGGDIFGKILRDVLGGALGGGGGAQPQSGPIPTPTQTQAPTPPMKDLSDLTRQLGVMGGAGAAVFGDTFEHGQDVDQSHLDNIQGILDRSYAKANG